MPRHLYINAQQVNMERRARKRKEDQIHVLANADTRYMEKSKIREMETLQSYLSTKQELTR